MTATMKGRRDVQAVTPGNVEELIDAMRAAIRETAAKGDDTTELRAELRQLEDRREDFTLRAAEQQRLARENAERTARAHRRREAKEALEKIDAAERKAAELQRAVVTIGALAVEIDGLDAEAWRVALQHVTGDFYARAAVGHGRLLARSDIREALMASGAIPGDGYRATANVEAIVREGAAALRSYLRQAFTDGTDDTEGGI